MEVMCGRAEGQPVSGNRMMGDSKRLRTVGQVEIGQRKPRMPPKVQTRCSESHGTSESRPSSFGEEPKPGKVDKTITMDP